MREIGRIIILRFWKGHDVTGHELPLVLTLENWGIREQQPYRSNLATTPRRETQNWRYGQLPFPSHPRVMHKTPPSSTVTIRKFSEVETLTDLEALPGCPGQYGFRKVPTPSPPSPAFLESVIGTDAGKHGQLEEAFGNLWLPRPPAPSEFLQSMKDLCTLIQFCSLRPQWGRKALRVRATEAERAIKDVHYHHPLVSQTVDYNSLQK